MLYVRRQHHATSTFAWPPTREDLDLIEVVEADTLRPVHAHCDEPEPQRPAPPALLKSVTPVRRIVRPDSALDRPSPRSVPARSQPFVVRAKPVLDRVSRRWIRLSRQFDPSWLIATVAAIAVSMSAYLSLRAAPVVPASDQIFASTAPPRPAERFTVTPFSPFTQPVMSWVLPIANSPARQAAQTSPRSTKHASAHTVISRARPPLRLKAGASVRSRLAASPRPPSRRPSHLQRPPAASADVLPLALNTRRSPFLSNVIESMPTAPALSPALDTSRRDLGRLGASSVRATAYVSHTAVPSTPSTLGRVSSPR